MLHTNDFIFVFLALTVLTIDLAAEIGLKSTQFGFILGFFWSGMVLGAEFLKGHWGGKIPQALPLIGFF